MTQVEVTGPHMGRSEAIGPHVAWSKVTVPCVAWAKVTVLHRALKSSSGPVVRTEEGHRWDQHR